MAYNPVGMRSFTIALNENAYEQLTTLAAQRGESTEATAGHLIEWELRRREARVAEALAVLDELDARQDPLSEEEAMALAVAEVRLMRAEHRARAADRL